jgi:hypothetical protein
VLSLLSRLILPSLINRSFLARTLSSKTEAGSSFGSCGSDVLLSFRAHKIGWYRRILRKIYCRFEIADAPGLNPFFTESVPGKEQKQPRIIFHVYQLDCPGCRNGFVWFLGRMVANHYAQFIHLLFIK